MALELSCELGHLSVADVERATRLFAAFNLPVKAPKVAAAKLVAHMQRDKKNEGGVITLVLLKRLGEAYLDRSQTSANLTAFLSRQIDGS